MSNGLATAKEIFVGPQEMYTSIQSAIDTSVPNDTVIVKKGIYNETLIVDKSIHLRGKDGYLNTVIKGIASSENAITIIEDHVTINGFTVFSGIYIENANNCELKNNVFYSDQSVEAHGIYLFQSLSTIISNCTFRHLNQGIYLDSTHNNSLSENVFSFCDSGLFLSESNQNLIYGNTYVSNSIAVNIYISNRNTVVGNLVHKNETGIQLYASRDVIISNNSFDENESAIYAKNSDNNIIFLNNFIHNTSNVSSSESNNHWNSLCDLKLKYNQLMTKMKLGNFYSDNASDDLDMNGISDSEFSIHVNEPNDLFPLAFTTDNYLIQTWQFNQDNMMYWNKKDIAPGKISLSEKEKNIYLFEPEYPEIRFTEVDSWDGQIAFISPPAIGYTLLIEFGYVTDNLDFVAKGPSTVLTGNDHQYIYPFKCLASPYTVPIDNIPALQITKFKSWGYDILTGGLWSFVSPPLDDLYSLYTYKTPEIVSVYPSFGATGINTVSPVFVNFSELMDASSLTKTTIQIENDQGIIIPIDISAAGTTVKLHPKNTLREYSTYTVTIFQDVKDTLGNSLSELFQTYFTTGSGPDRKPPTIIQTSPCNQCLNEKIDISVAVVFSEPMQSSSINLSTIQISDGIDNITGSISYDGITATFIPQTPLTYHTQYQVIVTTNVQDIAGNSLVNPYSFVFMTTENIIYVGQNEIYSNIQAAIDVSSDNAHVIVRDGEYYENIIINRPLILKSENGYTHTTIIGSDTSKSVIHILESNVNVQGFSLYGATQYPSSGIFIDTGASGCHILNNQCGITNDNNNAFGIYLNATQNNYLFNNLCTFNTENGIYVESSHKNSFINNQCMFNAKAGIHLEASQYNQLMNNLSSNNDYGILLKMHSCRDNVLYLNSFKENDINSALSDNKLNQWYSPTSIQYKFNQNIYKSFIGNYYSDFSGPDTKNDGIIDQPHNINQINDLYPLGNDIKQYFINVWWFQNNDILTTNIFDLLSNKIVIEGYSTHLFKNLSSVESDMNYAWGDIFNGQLAFSQAPGSNDRFILEMGYCSENNTFYPIGPFAEIAGDNISTTHIFHTGTKNFTIPKGNYFAVRITNQSAWDYELITGNALSYISIGEIRISYVKLDISISPLDTGAVSAEGILCPGDCTENYTSNATIRLTTAPKSGYIFDHWEGDIEAAESELNIVMSSDKNVIAVFTEKPPAPEVIGPENESIFYQTPVTLEIDNAVSYTKLFAIKQCGKPYQLPQYPDSFYTETLSSSYTLPATDIKEGLKYIWKSGYRDLSSGQVIWSEESSFKIGTISASENIQIAAGITSDKFRLISIPYWPEKPEAEILFSQSIIGSYQSNYKIATYDPGIGAYVEYGNDLKLEPGRSYWFLARDGMNCQIQGIPVAKNSDLDIELLYNSSTDEGWNMIGCPNEKDYYWGYLQVLEYDDNGSIRSGPFHLSDTVSDVDKLIDRRIWYWENSDYTPSSSDVFILQKNSGYWVHINKENVVLRFPVSAQVSKKRSVKGARNKKLRKNYSSTIYPPSPIDDLRHDKANSSKGIESECFIQTICFPINKR